MNLNSEFVKEHQGLWELFSQFVCFKIKDDNQECLWCASWCDDVGMKDRFLEAFLGK